MTTDWKQVAAERLRKIHSLEYQAQTLKEHLADELERELSNVHHAMCLSFPGGREKLADMASYIAERLRPKLYGR